MIQVAASGDVGPGDHPGMVITNTPRAGESAEQTAARSAPRGKSERKGDWMQTATGRQFWPLDPRPEEIHIDDIAAALAKLCRFSGHCLRFYSVAEHCVHVMRAAPKHLKLTALLHDASEAYLCDVIRPIKPHLSNYLDIESRLERAIALRYRLEWPWPWVVKRIDTAILADERDQAMAPPPQPWTQTTEPALGVDLCFWSPTEAEHMFKEAFYIATAGQTQ